MTYLIAVAFFFVWAMLYIVGAWLLKDFRGNDAFSLLDLLAFPVAAILIFAATATIIGLMLLLAAGLVGWLSMFIRGTI